MSAPFTPINQPTPAQAAATRIIQSGNMMFAQLMRVFQQNYNAVWNNTNATPDQVVAAMGTNAQAIFAASAGMAAYLNSLGASPALPESIPAGWAYNEHTDGSVTLTPSS